MGNAFTWWAEHALWRVSRGLPRLVNIIAAKAMMLAYGRGAQQVTRRHVMAAARDTLAARKGVPIVPLAWGLVLLGLTAAAAAGWDNTLYVADLKSRSVIVYRLRYPPER